MKTCQSSSHLRFNLWLAAAFLLLSWFQLHHEITAHLDGDSDGCEICAFNGNLGNSLTTEDYTAQFDRTPLRAHVASIYNSPTVAQPFRLVLSQRGPPAFSDLI